MSSQVDICAIIETLAPISPAAANILSEIFDCDFENSVLQHFRTFLYASTTSVKIVRLSETVEKFIKVRKIFGQKSDGRLLMAFESTVKELKDKFSLQVSFEKTEKECLSNFRNVALISESALNSSSVDLQKNIVKGSYGTIENYLKIHFDLLWEDFLTPLRDGLNKLSGMAPKSSEYDLYSYGKVEFSELKTNYDKVTATFQLTDADFDVEASRRLMSGSLVVIVDDKMSLYIGTVADKTSKSVEIDFQKSDDFLKILSLARGNKASHLRLYESSVYFEAYCHILSCLQVTTDIPFSDNLIEGASLVVTPSFFDKKLEIDISVLFDKKTIPKPDSRFNNSQEVFLKRNLCFF